MQPKIFVVSDVHVKARLWTNFSGIQGDAYRAMEEISSHARSGIYLISCGDLLDSNRPSSRDLEVLRKFCSNFSKVLFISGNHDTADPSFLEQVCDNCYHLSSSTVEMVGNLAVYGIDWQPSKDQLIERLLQVKESASQLPEGCEPVLVMHQAVRCFQSMEGVYTITEQEISEILGGKFFVLVGDIHSHRYMSVPNGCTLLSPGPIVPQDIGQAKLPQYWHSIENGRLEEHQISVRDFVFKDADMEDFSLEDVLVEIHPERGRLPTVVVLVSSIPISIPKHLRDSEDYIIVTKIKGQEAAQEVVRDSGDSLTLEDVVVREAEETEPDLAEKIISIYKHMTAEENPDEFLEALLKKWEVTC